MFSNKGKKAIMTDRIHGVLVVLENDVRIDDAEVGVLVALRQIKGVVSVRPLTADLTSNIVRARLRAELVPKLLKVLEDY